MGFEVIEIVTWKGSLDALNTIEPSLTFPGMSSEDLCELGGSFLLRKGA